MIKYLFHLLIISLILLSCQSLPPQTEDTKSTGTITTPSVDATMTDEYLDERLTMVAKTIEARGVKNPDVLRAMRDVPRHLFVPEDMIIHAYEDHPLPIGFGQTISQPYIVAWMTELLEIKPGEVVLEIGTGSGYQAAVLAELGYAQVYSIEIIPQLAQSAQERLKTLGYQVEVLEADGYFGWEEHAPFDAIIVTAAPDHLPSPLVAQLKDGGRMVVPIGPPGGYQSLWKFVKEGDDLQAYNLGGVAFVPFTGEGIELNNPPPFP